MPRLKHGLTLVFDHDFCWSATRVSGERRAMLESLHDSADWKLPPYRPCSRGGNSCVVESRKYQVSATDSHRQAVDGSWCTENGSFSLHGFQFFFSIGCNPAHTFIMICGCASAFGCMPSSCINSRCSATWSSNRGIRGMP